MIKHVLILLALSAFINSASAEKSSNSLESIEQERKEIQQDLKKTYAEICSLYISKYRFYPRLAERRGWEGDVLLEVEIDRQGNLVKADILEESRYKLLNNGAIDMVKRASPFPQPPVQLMRNGLIIQIPISFRLPEVDNSSYSP